MAIGKVNAYATIQAPNVDFGEVALNAQKFQEADLERQKELKLAQLKAEKPKPFVFTPQVLKEDSGLDFFNISQRQTVADTMQEYYDLSLKNEKGELGAEGGAKLYALQQNIQNADQALKSVGGHYKEYIKGIKDHSGAFKENENYLQGFTANNGQNVIRTNDSNGNPYFQQVEIEEKTKKHKIGDDGKPIIKKFIDKYGVERDGWGYADILSGKAFEPLNAFDDQKFATDVAKLVSPYKTGSDTGITKIVRETLTPSNISTINTMIETQVLNNREHLADVLYKLDPIKYKDPKADYTKEDREFAKLGMEKSIYGGIGLSSVKDVNLAEQREQKKEEVNKYALSLIPDSILNKVSPDVIRDGFVVVKDAKPTSQSGFGVADFNTGKRVRIETGSTLTGITKGKNGIAIVRVAVPVTKSSTYGKSKDINFTYNPNLSKEENDLELQRVTQGITTEEKFYYASDAVVNALLKGNSSIRDYKQIKQIVSDKNWKKKAPKKGVLD